jgi:hypothetical protein
MAGEETIYAQKLDSVGSVYGLARVRNMVGMIKKYLEE